MDEDALHVLRNSKFAKEIWIKFIPATKRTFFSLPLKEWPQMNLGDSNLMDSNWATLLLQLHGGCGDGITLDALKIVSLFLITHVTLILKAFDTRCTLTEKAKLRKEMLVCWESPDFGWLKLNIDVVAKGNLGLACGGGVL